LDDSSLLPFIRDAIEWRAVSALAENCEDRADDAWKPAKCDVHAVTRRISASAEKCLTSRRTFGIAVQVTYRGNFSPVIGKTRCGMSAR